MTDPECGPSAVQGRPLCRRYALVIPGVAPVHVRDAGGIGKQPLFWVLGWLADGECEALGLCLGAQAPPQMLDDFRRRGLERVWHLEPPDDGCAQEAVGATLAIERAFPGALASSRPHMLPDAAAVARDIGDRLIRAVRRHGHFESEAAALDFVVRALQRAERGLDRERLMARTQPRLDANAQVARVAA